MRKITCVTYWPCHDVEYVDEDGGECVCVEQCSPDDATFWGLYVRDKDGFAIHVTDCATEQQADELAQRLTVALDVELEVYHA